MNVKMNKLMLACILLGSSAAAVAAPEFSDRKEVTENLTFERRANPLDLSIMQSQDGYAGDAVPDNTEVATLSIRGTLEAAQLAYRWKAIQGVQTVDGNTVTVKMNGDNATDTIRLKIETAGTSVITDPADNGDYFVSNNKETQLTRVISLAGEQRVPVGTYQVAIEAAVYNL